MGSIGSHGEPLVAVGDVFNPPADINAATLFAKKVGGFRADSRSVRLALAAPDVWEGLYFADTDTPCLWEYQGGDWVLRNNPTFGSASLRDAAIPAPQAGYMVFRSDKNYPESYDGTKWSPARTGVVPIYVDPSKITVAGVPSSPSVVVDPDGWINFTNVPDVTILGCLSPDFRSYEVEWLISGMAASTFLTMRFLTAAVSTTSGYFYHSSFGTGGSQVNADASNQNQFAVSDSSSTNFGYGLIRMHDVAVAGNVKQIIAEWTRINGAGTAAANGIVSGWQGTGAAVYTGLLFLPLTSNMTGRLRIRGVV